MSTELKIFKNGNGQAISIKKKTMEQLNLEIGDILNVEKRGNEIVLTKKENLTFEEEWQYFFENGGTYEDLQEVDWGEDQGREQW